MAEARHFRPKMDLEALKDAEHHLR